MACPTSTVCFSGTGGGTADSILISDDSGNSWAEYNFTEETLEFSALSCYTQQFCVAIANNDGLPLLVPMQDGSIEQVSVSDADQLEGITCVSSTTCIAVGSQVQLPGGLNTVYQGLVLVTQDGGNTWTQSAVPSDLSVLYGISCPSTTTCFAAGAYYGPDGSVPAIVTSDDGGTTWSLQSVPDAQDRLTGISCLSDLDCVAVGGTDQLAVTAFRTIEGGSTWTTEPIDGMETVTGISCTQSSCVASGDTLYGGTATSLDGGVTWQTQSFRDSGTASSVSCTADGHCVSVVSSSTIGAYVYDSSDSGQTWSRDAIPPLVTSMSGISCSADDLCTAVGQGPNGFEILTSDSGDEYTPSVSTVGPDNSGISGGVTVQITGVDLSNVTSVLFGTNASSSFTINSDTSITAVAPVGAMAGPVDVSVTTPTSASPNASGDVFTYFEPPAFVDEATPSFNVGTAGTYIIQTTGYPTPSITESGALPTGLSFTDNGNGTAEISGTPADGTGGVYELTFTATGLGGATAVENDPLEVEPVVPLGQMPTTPTISNLPSRGTVGSGFTATVSTDGDGTTSVTSNSPGVCTANGLSVSYVGVGTCSLTAHVGVGSYYSAADGTPQSFSVSAPPPTPHGYWLVGTDGGIFSFGSAQFYGSAGNLHLQRPVLGIVPTKDRGGYWLDASDGGVFSFGDTQFYGSIPGLGLHPAGSGLPNSLDAPIVGMVASHDQGGYFMVASDGGVFAFGDATFAGSCPGIGGCAGAAVAVMPDASGNGYWLVTQTGHVYAFGDAPNLGAPGPQSSAINSAVATPSGHGYYIVDANGQVFAYGDATGGLGNVSPGATGGSNPASAIFVTSDGGGYWVSDARGDVYTFGDAPNDGSMAGTHLNGSIIAASGS